MEYLENQKILYVDDEKYIRENAIDYLTLYCNHVYGAKDGLEAFELYNMIRPDIIITDIKMPNLNGLELVRKIRTNDKNTKIIIATAYLETDYLLESIELGLIKYLIKPITQDKLLPVLNSCLDDLVEKKSIFAIDQNHYYDIFNKVLFKNNQQIALTKKEIYSMELLIKNNSRAVTYEEFNSYVWSGEMTIDALRTVIRELRNKISKESITNVSGIGYKIQNHDN